MSQERHHPNYWIGERPVYPGHPVTCALIVLRAYPDDLEEAWKPYSEEEPWRSCESYVDVPTAGGALSNGCDIIRSVIGGMGIERAILWGDEMWMGAGGHPANEAPGQEQADRLKPALREALAEMLKKRSR